MAFGEPTVRHRLPGRSRWLIESWLPSEMGLSRASVRHCRCPGCGNLEEQLLWDVIDGDERPDLINELSQGGPALARCGSCGADFWRDDCFLVIDLSPQAPLILACSEEVLRDEAREALFESMLGEAFEAAKAQRRHVPAPALTVPFAVVAMAVGRNLEDDLANRERAISEVDLPEWYGMFLDDIETTREARRLNEANPLLLGITSQEALERVVADFPEILTDASLAFFGELLEGAQEGEPRHIAEMRLRFVEDLQRAGPQKAWEAHQERLRALARDRISPAVAQMWEAMKAAEGLGDWPAAILAGRELQEYVPSAEDPFVISVCARLGAALYRHYERDGDNADLDEAIQLFERGLELLPEEPDEELKRLATELNMNAGTAWAANRRGDPEENLRRAIVLMQNADSTLSRRDSPDEWAMLMTNLGHAFLELARYAAAASETDRDELVAEAIASFETALLHRSFERDPGDWAYTQVNLGVAFERSSGHRDLARAIEHHQLGARGFEAAGMNALTAHALHNAASATRLLAATSVETDGQRQNLLEEAFELVEGALEVDRPVVETGRSFKVRGDVLVDMGDLSAAAESYGEAAALLTPDLAPEDSREAATRCAELQTELENWTEAAGAWETAAEAGLVGFNDRESRRGRFTEIRATQNLSRWAAYAMVKVGKPDRAVELLELGRGRELAAWLGREDPDLRLLGRLAPALHDEYVALIRQLSSSELSGGVSHDTAPLARRLKEVRADIRRLPNLENFGLTKVVDEIAQSLSDNDALVYPITTPKGSCIVLLQGGNSPGIHVIDLPDLTSMGILRSLGNDQDPTSFLFAQEDAADVGPGLAAVSAHLGPALVEPLDALATSLCLSRLCLVPVGLLARVPLHALEWEDEGRRKALLDGFEVVVAPSALARATCLRRSRERPLEGRSLVVGNPLPHPLPLPGAAREAAIVASMLSVDDEDFLLETTATREAVLQRLPGASLVHFACHGEASTSPEDLQSGLSLANDERISIPQLLELEDFSPRLVVASACETGLTRGYAEVDEVLSLSTGLIGAGAAGVIASFWAVNDYATSLLMSRFYEYLPTSEPSDALRKAQLWLRDLRADEERDYVDSRAGLQALRARESENLTRSSVDREFRFRSPVHWGAFAYFGA